MATGSVNQHYQGQGPTGVPYSFTPSGLFIPGTQGSVQPAARSIVFPPPTMTSRSHISTILGLLDGVVRRGNILVGFDVEQVNHNFSRVLVQGDFLDCGLCVLCTDDITMAPSVSDEYQEHLVSLLRTTYLRDSAPLKLANRNIDWKLTEQGIRQPGPLQRYPRMAPNTGRVEPGWGYAELPLPAIIRAVKAAIPNAPTTTLIVHDTNLETRLLASWGHVGSFVWYDTQLGDHEEFCSGRRKLKVLCQAYDVAADEWDFHNSGFDATFTMRVALAQADRCARRFFEHLAAQAWPVPRQVEPARPPPFQGTVYYNASTTYRPGKVEETKSVRVQVGEKEKKEKGKAPAAAPTAPALMRS